jgi:hypothetical protein
MAVKHCLTLWKQHKLHVAENMCQGKCKYLKRDSEEEWNSVIFTVLLVLSELLHQEIYCNNLEDR